MSTLGSIVRIVCLALFLSGCATPDIRNLVYNRVDASATIVAEADPLPRPAHRTNRFRYVPGSILRSGDVLAPDIFSGKAGVLKTIEAECFQTAFSLARVKRTRRGPEELNYDVKLSLGLPGSFRAFSAFARDFNLEEIPPNILTHIRQVSIRLSNIQVYEANESQIDRAITQIGKSHNDGKRLCTLLYDRHDRTLVVKRIYVAHVRTRIRWDDGFNSKLGKVWEFRLQQSLRYAFRGNRVVFAITADPVQRWNFISLLSVRPTLSRQ